MTTVSLAPTSGVLYQAFSNGGLPLNAGYMYSYAAGTTTPLATYTTSAGNVANANPIVFDASGRPPSEIWLVYTSAYRFDLYDSLGNLIKTYDNVGGIASSSDLAASTGAGLIGFSHSASYAADTVGLKLQQVISVTDAPYDAAGDGTTDDTAAIQAAINHAGSLGGAIVYFPAGTYKITSALTITDDDVILQGSGVIGTILAPSTGSIDCIDVGVSAAITYNTQIRDLRIEYGSGTTVSAGQAILLLHTYYPIIENVYINNPYVGIAIAPSVGVRISFCDLIGLHAKGGLYGIHMYGDSNVISGFVTVPTQISIETCHIFGPAIAGFTDSIHYRAGEQVSIRDCYIAQGYAYNINILQDSNNWSIYDTFISDTYIDAATTAGIIISGAGGNGSNNIQNVHIANCVLKGQSGDGIGGISVDGTDRGSTYPQALNGLKITNTTIAGWKGNGIDLEGGYGTTITGCEIKGNNYLNSLSACGIVIGANALQTTITGNRIGGDAFSANSANAFQAAGVRADSGASNFSICGNDVTGNTAGITDNSGSATKTIQDNFGHVPTPIGILSNIPIGPVAYNALGTNAIHVAGTIYVAEIYVPAPRTVTGIGILNGATVGTDKLIVALYLSNGGGAIANSDLTGTVTSGANAFQNIALTAPLKIYNPGRYWIAVQCNGTTDTTRRIAANTYLNWTKATAGSFGTISSLTVPTSTAADAGPIGYLY